MVRNSKLHVLEELVGATAQNASAWMDTPVSCAKQKGKPLQSKVVSLKKFCVLFLHHAWLAEAVRANVSLWTCFAEKVRSSVQFLHFVLQIDGGFWSAVDELVSLWLL